METIRTNYDDPPSLDIVDAIVAAGLFSIFRNALSAAGLVATLKTPGPFTVFAPTDSAFRKWPRGILDDLLKDRPRLVEVIKGHVVPGKIMARSLRNSDAESLQGGLLRIAVSDDGVRINNAKVMKTDIETSNGVVHSVDTVLMHA